MNTPVQVNDDGATLVFPDSVVAMAVNAMGELAIVRQWRHVPAIETLELPGGKLEKDEKPIDGATRELREEAGLVWLAPTLALSLDMDFSVSKHTTHIVRGCVAESAAVGAFRVEFFSFSQLRTLVAQGAITHAPTVVAIQLGLLDDLLGDASP